MITQRDGLTILLVWLILLLAPTSLTAQDQASQQAPDQTQPLKTFSENLSSFTAAFEQTVYDADSRVLQSSSGTVALQRPGKFSWHYLQPNEQQIVADGAKVWIYDPDLEQVTVSPLDERASGTPLALLMGEAPLDQEFKLKSLGESEGIDWFELQPKSNDNDFEVIYIGLNQAGLAVMELRDNFGQATQIKFTDFVSNVTLDEAQFQFKPPAGVDVIGEG